MTHLHQLEREYTFTPQELQYLLTTQRLAEENIRAWVDNTLKPEPAFVTVLSDVQMFGPEVRDAIEDNRLTIPVKMGVIYWLNSIWHPMFQQFPKEMVFHEDAVPFNREDIRRIHLLLLKDYIDYVIHKG